MMTSPSTSVASALILTFSPLNGHSAFGLFEIGHHLSTTLLSSVTDRTPGGEFLCFVGVGKGSTIEKVEFGVFAKAQTKQITQKQKIIRVERVFIAYIKNALYFERVKTLRLPPPVDFER